MADEDFGSRKFKFESGVFTLEVLNTDFAAKYSASRSDEGAVEIQLVLSGVWEAPATPGVKRLLARAELEQRFRELAWDWTGRKGTLTLDEGATFEVIHSDLTLRSVEAEDDENNAALLYSLEFAIPVTTDGTAVEIARDIEFAPFGPAISAENFIVEWTRSDRTVFKQPFRAAPVRVAAGPPTEQIAIKAFQIPVAGASPLAKRQAAELEMKDWQEIIGQAGALTIDGSLVGTVHLAAVQPSNLSLADSVLIELVFVKGYID